MWLFKELYRENFFPALLTISGLASLLIYVSGAQPLLSTTPVWMFALPSCLGFSLFFSGVSLNFLANSKTAALVSSFSYLLYICFIVTNFGLCYGGSNADFFSLAAFFFLHIAIILYCFDTKANTITAVIWLILFSNIFFLSLSLVFQMNFLPLDDKNSHYQFYFFNLSTCLWLLITLVPLVVYLVKVIPENRKMFVLFFSLILYIGFFISLSLSHWHSPENVLTTGVTVTILQAGIFAIIDRFRSSLKKNKGDALKDQNIKTQMSLILNKSPLAIFIINKAGEITYFNDRAVVLTGYAASELQNMPIERLVPHSLRKAHKAKRLSFTSDPINRSMNAGLNLFLVTKENNHVAIDIDLLPIEYEGESQIMCSVLDTSKQREYENNLNVQFKNTQLTLDIINISNEISNFNDFLKIVLDKMALTLGWDIGHIYIFPEKNKHALRSSGIWYLKDPERSVPFIKLTNDLHFDLKQGTLGKMWSGEKIYWIENIDKEASFLRRIAEDEYKMKGCVFMPILFEKEIAFVIELFSFTEKSQNTYHENTLEIIAQQISRVYERKQSSIKLKTLAHYDEMTGLPNRLSFQEKFDHVLHRCKRNHRSFALLHLDIDDFKKINDSFGHIIGDKLLKLISENIKNKIHNVDFIARFSGDEFVLLTENIKSQEDIELLAKEILSLFKQEFEVENYRIELSLSIGIAIYPEAGKDKKLLLRNAEIAMSRAKELGKFQYQFFTDKLKKKHERSLAIEKGLKDALVKQEFYLVYQPQINLQENRISGFEVLIRWRSETLGEVSPFEFISKAEDMGLIHDIGYWVFKNACAQFNEWRSAFNDIGFQPSISVNVSAIQLMHEDMLNNFKTILSTFNYPSSALTIELTESSFMNNHKKSKQILDEFHNLGVGLAVDDFGTGYSSFGYLKEYPFSELKIDKIFIDKIESDANGRSIIQAIIRLAEVMHLDIVAEGVEEKAQLEYLIEYNNALKDKNISVQGYYFSKPLPADEIIPFIKNFHQN